MGWRSLLISAFLLSATAFADDGPLFGPEFTFAPKDFDSFNKRVIAHLVEGQPEGAKFEARLSYTYASPNGWWFQLAQDAGVVEVRMSPMTVKGFWKYASDIQDAIFASASNAGMFPGLYVGGGHVNMDVAYFYEQQPRLLRNFLVDFVNHSELSLGIFSYDSRNAGSLAISPDAREHFARIIAKFDAGGFGDVTVPSEETVHEFLNEMKAAFSGKRDMIRELWTTGVRTAKSFEMNFDRSTTGAGPGYRRFELRAFRPQESMAVWMSQIALLRDRIFYLKTVKGLIPFKPAVAYSHEQLRKSMKLNPPISPQWAMQRFYEYVTEAGHHWSQHRDYIWPQWRFRQKPDQPSKLELFEQSDWFLERQGTGCKTLLPVPIQVAA